VYTTPNVSYRTMYTDWAAYQEWLSNLLATSQPDAESTPSRITSCQLMSCSQWSTGGRCFRRQQVAGSPSSLHLEGKL